MGFGSKAQSKNAKRCQIERSTKWLSRIVKNLVYDPNKLKFRFSKINSFKIIFEDIQNTGIYSIQLYSNNQCTKFQANIFIFGCAMTQKPGEDDDVTF